MGTILDTSVLIEYERGGAYFGLNDGTDLAISAVTASELLHGLHRAKNLDTRRRRAAFVNATFQALPIVPFDLRVAGVHARVGAAMASRGRVPSPHDLMIAATALATACSITTKNVRDFIGVPGLTVVPAV